MTKNSILKYQSLLIIGILIMIYIFSFSAVKTYRDSLKKGENVLYLPPAELVNLISLDYKNIISQTLFIRGMVYYGEMSEKRKAPDWHYLYKLLDNATQLDPYNIDVYYFANASLPWEGGLAKETNAMLERGFKYRNWDWYMPWFIATNYAYFLKDNSKAADYYAETSRLNPSFAPTATQYYLKANRTAVGIDFLKRLYEETTNKDLKESIGNNLLLLQQIYILQEAIKKYNLQPGKKIQHLQELITDGIIQEIPTNPFIEFFWDKEKNILNFTKKEQK